MRRIFALVLVVSFTAVLTERASAQTYELRGSVREWVKNYLHDPYDRGLLESRVKLELLSALGDNSAFRVKSYYIYDGLSKTGAWDFQEAYIDFYSSRLDLRFGKQVIPWGKADELNPTDVLNPQDLANITEEKNIRKTGLLAVKGDVRLGENTLILVWKPEFDYVRIPTRDPRLELIPIPGAAVLPDPVMPANELDQTEWAVKLERTFGMYDISVSYFDGWDNIFSPVFDYAPAHSGNPPAL